MRGAIDKWVIKKGIEGTRDAQGRFVTRKSLVFMISSAIYNRGLKPTFFISDTRKRLKSKALLWLAQALGEDVASALRLNLKLNKNLDVK